MQKKKLFTSTFLLGTLVLTGCGAAGQDGDAASSPSQSASASAPASSASASGSASASNSATTSESPSASGSGSASSSPSGSASGTPAEGRVDLSDHTFPVSWKDAHQKATEKFDGDLSKIELERSDDGKYHYKIELRSDSQKYAMQVDANTGDVISEKTDDESDGARKREQKTVNLDDVVSLDQAMDAAKKAQDGRVDEWKLEGDENAGPQYEFDITEPGASEDYEVTVDAKNGKVTEVDS